MGLHEEVKNVGGKLKTDIEYSNGSAQTDVEIVAAVEGKTIQVISLEAATSDQSAGSIIFTTTGSNTRIGARFQLPIYHTSVRQIIPEGQNLQITNPALCDYKIRYKQE